MTETKKRTHTAHSCMIDAEDNLNAIVRQLDCGDTTARRITHIIREIMGCRLMISTLIEDMERESR